VPHMRDTANSDSKMAGRKADDEQHKARAAAAASDSDDEAPEEFSKDNAKEQALRRLQQEEEARVQAAAAAAAKRCVHWRVVGIDKACRAERLMRWLVVTGSARRARRRRRRTRRKSPSCPRTCCRPWRPNKSASPCARSGVRREFERTNGRGGDAGGRTEAADDEAARERTRKRHAALRQKQTHVRQFGHVQVRTLASAESDAEAASRALSGEAKAFLARRAAPLRARMSVLEGHPSLFTKKQKQRAGAQRA
jgi:hypothetical protein